MKINLYVNYLLNIPNRILSRNLNLVTGFSLSRSLTSGIGLAGASLAGCGCCDGCPLGCSGPSRGNSQGSPR